jgi:hypothetical protein
MGYSDPRSAMKPSASDRWASPEAHPGNYRLQATSAHKLQLGLTSGKSGIFESCGGHVNNATGIE